jgi:hypothetical protein
MAADPDDGIANAFVASILAAGADKGYRSLDVFVTWFFAGSAAAMGLAAANSDKLSWLISTKGIREGLPLFGFILLLVLISKFFGSLICTMAGAMEASVGVMRQFNEIRVPAVGLSALAAALRRARPWPLRALAWVWTLLNCGRKPNLGKVVIWFLMISGFCALSAACLTVLFWAQLLMN